jgi:hypothetical protein
MKNIKYQTVSTIPKYNQNNLETEAKSIPVIDIYIATHFLACFVDRCLKHKYYNPFLGLYFCFILAFVLSVLLWFTISNYSFDYTQTVVPSLFDSTLKELSFSHLNLMQHKHTEPL